MRALLLALVMTGCAAPAAAPLVIPAPQAIPAPPEPVVLEHTHRRAEIGRSCAETCYPGRCAVSYDITAQTQIDCHEDAKRHANCICQAPER